MNLIASKIKESLPVLNQVGTKQINIGTHSVHELF